MIPRTVTGSVTRPVPDLLSWISTNGIGVLAISATQRAAWSASTCLAWRSARWKLSLRPGDEWRAPISFVGVPRLLQAEPEVRARTEISPKALGRIGRDTAASAHDLIDTPPRHAEVLGERILRQVQGTQEPCFEEHSRGQSGAPARASVVSWGNRVHRHRSAGRISVLGARSRLAPDGAALRAFKSAGRPTSTRRSRASPLMGAALRAFKSAGRPTSHDTSESR